MTKDTQSRPEDYLWKYNAIWFNCCSELQSELYKCGQPERANEIIDYCTKKLEELKAITPPAPSQDISYLHECYRNQRPPTYDLVQRISQALQSPRPREDLPDRAGQLSLCASGLISLLYQEPDDIKQVREYIVPELRKCLAVNQVRDDVPEGWRPIETAPKNGDFITGIWWSGNVTHGFPFVCQWDGDKWATPDSTGCTVREPSHWSPIIALPAAPNAEVSK